MDDALARIIASDILQYVDVRTYQLDRQKYDVSVSIKPTKRSSDDIEYIGNSCPKGNSFSLYFPLKLSFELGNDFFLKARNV